MKEKSLVLTFIFIHISGILYHISKAVNRPCFGEDSMVDGEDGGWKRTKKSKKQRTPQPLVSKEVHRWWFLTYDFSSLLRPRLSRFFFGLACVSAIGKPKEIWTVERDQQPMNRRYSYGQTAVNKDFLSSEISSRIGDQHRSTLYTLINEGCNRQDGKGVS